MTLPQKPKACAIRITKLLQEFQKITGESFYPLDMHKVVKDISLQFFPDAPIKNIIGGNFSSNIDGMLKYIPDEDEWGIIYNKNRSEGRINFTLAHELGHHLIHRPKLQQDVFECKREDMFAADEMHGIIEKEANEFASYLLMPRNDFETILADKEITLHLLQEIADHFKVSLTAAILKWLSFTSKRAMIVVGVEGFIDWVWSSDPLRKSGVYLQPKKEAIELPTQSLAVQYDEAFDNESGIMHKAGIWPFNEDVREMTIVADSYDMTITLLMFSDDPPNKFAYHEDGNGLMDTYQKFQQQNNRAR